MILNAFFFMISETAPSVASDDEASNAATEGSTIRTPPAETNEGAGSESGGSGVESIGGAESIEGASGRSSNYGDHQHASPPKGGEVQSVQPQPSTSAAAMGIPKEVRQEEADDTNEAENTKKLHVLR